MEKLLEGFKNPRDNEFVGEVLFCEKFLSLPRKSYFPLHRTREVRASRPVGFL